MHASRRRVKDTMQRLDQINRFYDALHVLEDRLGGKRFLAECHGKMKWPRRGVYFFFELGEKRSTCPDLRVARVGTHALKQGSRSTLWGRLRTHRGSLKGKHPGGGNHRGSIFRLHVGTAILKRGGLDYPTWGVGSSTSRKLRDLEYPVEKRVSQHIRLMPFVWLEVNDPPGPSSKRAYIERNSISLLSNFGRLGTASAIDPPSAGWLGHFCRSEMVRESGLWNVNHVAEEHVDAYFLQKLERRVRKVQA